MVALLALPILVTHQTEEWVRPGGFLPFCNERPLGSNRPTWPLTERDGFHVDVTLGWGSAILATVLWERTAAPAAFRPLDRGAQRADALWDGAARARYNPGLVTATLLMGLHSAGGAVALSRSGRLSPPRRPPRRRRGSRLQRRPAAGDEAADAARGGRR